MNKKEIAIYLTCLFLFSFGFQYGLYKHFRFHFDSKLPSSVQDFSDELDDHYQWAIDHPDQSGYKAVDIITGNNSELVKAKVLYAEKKGWEIDSQIYSMIYDPSFINLDFIIQNSKSSDKDGYEVFISKNTPGYHVIPTPTPVPTTVSDADEDDKTAKEFESVIGNSK